VAEIPDVHYARSGGVAVAYQVVGDGPQDLVFLPFLSNLYSLWQLPVLAEGTLRLAESTRLILVNTRGMGMSDRPRGLTIEARMDDVRAVMDAAGSTRANLLGWAETSNTCGVFAATYPERVERLILYAPYARGTRSDGYPWGLTREQALADLAVDRERWGERQYLEDFARRMNPQWVDDASCVDWFVWTHRLSSSPESYVEFRRMTLDTHLSDVLPAIRVPTLVLANDRMREPAAHAASLIPEARLVLLPGEGASLHENDAGLLAIESFLRDEAPPMSRTRSRNRVLHRPRRVDEARRGARRPRLARGARGTSCGGATRAVPVRRRRAGHRRRRVLRLLRRPRAGDRLRPGDRRGDAGARPADPRRHPTPASASGWVRSWRDWRSTSVPASQPLPAPGKCSSPGRCATSWPALASPSTISATTS
jgi:pimeloyl-ACP methyl ester carboxylesterase